MDRLAGTGHGRPDSRLTTIAAALTARGLHVTGPSDDEPLPGEPDTGFIAVHSPVTGLVAEVSVSSWASPRPGDQFLELTCWTMPSADPDGLLMAAAVARLLGACPGPEPAACGDHVSPDRAGCGRDGEAGGGTGDSTVLVMFPGSSPDRSSGGCCTGRRPASRMITAGTGQRS